MDENQTNDFSDRGVVVAAQIERSLAEERALREAVRPLVAFAVSSVPAMLVVAFNTDLYEGDFGPLATAMMILSGSMPVICTVTIVRSRRLWKMGRPLDIVLWVLYGLPLLTLVMQFIGLMVWSVAFLSSVGGE